MRKLISLVGMFLFCSLVFGDVYKVKASFSLFNAKYDVFRNDKQIGYITGEMVYILGNTFTWYDMNDKELFHETEVKRIFNLNRTAIVYNNKNIHLGYIGERVIDDYFNPGFTMHIYDNKKNEIGVSDQQFWSLLKKNIIYNNKKVVEYEIDQEFTLLFNEYTITPKVKTPTINIIYIIFLTAIEDAIIEVHSKK